MWVLVLLFQDALIQDLDSDDPAKREEATTKLVEMGAQALPAVRKAYKESPSPEVRSRAERILDAHVDARIRVMHDDRDHKVSVKPLNCRQEIERFFPGYRFYLVSFKDELVTSAFLTPENEVVEILLRENHKEKETRLIQEIRKAKVTVKNREEAQRFGLLWLLLAYGSEEFKVETTDHQNETRY
jgi:hypothetical protein